MKVKISCQKCKSTEISITSNPKDSTPMYKCNKCGHEANMFPQIKDTDKSKFTY